MSFDGPPPNNFRDLLLKDLIARAFEIGLGKPPGLAGNWNPTVFVERLPDINDRGKKPFEAQTVYYWKKGSVPGWKNLTTFLEFILYDHAHKSEWQELFVVAWEKVSKNERPISSDVQPIFPDTVRIPKGEFYRGSPSEEVNRKESESPRDLVKIDYEMEVAITPVSFREWDRFLEAQTHIKRAGDEGWGRNHRPAIYISWSDAQSYIRWLNDRHPTERALGPYRLLTETEWEYCARAGTNTPFCFGNSINHDQACFHGASSYGDSEPGIARHRTMEVGSYEPNKWGLLDMHGNVWEWTEDVYSLDYSHHPPTGEAFLEGRERRRCVRGGCFTSYARNLRSAVRYWYNIDDRDRRVGFRLARTVV